MISYKMDHLQNAKCRIAEIAINDEARLTPAIALAPAKGISKFE